LIIKYYAKNTQGQKIDKNTLINLFLLSWIGLILGGRIGYVVIYNLDFFIKNPNMILSFLSGGMSFHGALVGAWIFTSIYLKKLKINPFVFYDLSLTVAPIALFFGRIGNFINGELWGRSSQLPWSIIFPLAGPEPRHPSQLYEAFLEGLVLFLILNKNFIKNSQFIGKQSILFLFYYNLFRFFVEFFRQPDSQMGFYFDYLSMGQILSLSLILFLGVYLKYYAPKRSNT
jgi:phosphatidylglycerol:prolipoprotein diacylglycerol transferase